MLMAWPKTDDPRTEFITLRLTVGEADDVDWLILHTGASSRSEAVRDATARVIAAEKRRAAKTKTRRKRAVQPLDPDEDDS